MFCYGTRHIFVYVCLYVYIYIYIYRERERERERERGRALSDLHFYAVPEKCRENNLQEISKLK
jgi:hypothetical protein